MTLEVSRRWLTAMGLLVTCFGIVMALASATPLFELFNRLIDPAFWSAGPPDPGTAAFRAWVYGAWGATLAGWGVVITVLAWKAVGSRESWAWWTLVGGTSLWFLLDTAVSLAHGVTFNVALNVVLLALIGVPAVATRSPGDPSLIRRRRARRAPFGRLVACERDTAGPSRMTGAACARR